jgi:hypothetical protein
MGFESGGVIDFGAYDSTVSFVSSLLSSLSNMETRRCEGRRETRREDDVWWKWSRFPKTD